MKKLIAKLAKLANYLDSRKLLKEADEIDKLMRLAFEPKDVPDKHTDEFKDYDDKKLIDMLKQIKFFKDHFYKRLPPKMQELLDTGTSALIKAQSAQKSGNNAVFEENMKEYQKNSDAFEKLKKEHFPG